MRANSLRTALALVAVAGSMTLLNPPRAHAVDFVQVMCGVRAEKTYIDSKGNARAAAYDIYQNDIGRCRHVSDGVRTVPKSGL